MVHSVKTLAPHTCSHGHSSVIHRTWHRFQYYDHEAWRSICDEDELWGADEKRSEE